MKQTITPNEYLQLLGLQTLSVEHYKRCLEIEKAVATIIDGHIDTMDGWDFITGDASLDQMLQRLNVTVEKDVQ